MDELIYTSVPEGLATGARGYCTVAQTRGTSKSLVGKLESLCNYKHVFAPGDANEHLNPINFQFVRFRDAGKAKYVLSRIGNAGFDYTQRTNFLAHNIALDRASLPKAGPIWFMNQQASFATQWDDNRRPEYLAERNTEGDASISPAICDYWKSIAGDAGYGGWLAESLLDKTVPEIVVAYSLGSDMLKLLGETFKLIPESARWQCTFSTYADVGNAAYDCKLRCVLVGSPAAKKASQSTKIAFLDLSDPFELRSSTFVELARTGFQQPITSPEPEKPVVEPTPAPIDSVTFVEPSPQPQPENAEATGAKDTQRWREIEEDEDWQEVVTSSSFSPLKKLVVGLAASLLLVAGVGIYINTDNEPMTITKGPEVSEQPKVKEGDESDSVKPEIDVPMPPPAQPTGNSASSKTEKKPSDDSMLVEKLKAASLDIKELEQRIKSFEKDYPDTERMKLMAAGKSGDQDNEQIEKDIETEKKALLSTINTSLESFMKNFGSSEEALPYYDPPKNPGDKDAALDKAFETFVTSFPVEAVVDTDEPLSFFAQIIKKLGDKYPVEHFKGEVEGILKEIASLKPDFTKESFVVKGNQEQATEIIKIYQRLDKWRADLQKTVKSEDLNSNKFRNDLRNTLIEELRKNVYNNHKVLYDQEKYYAEGPFYTVVPAKTNAELKYINNLPPSPPNLRITSGYEFEIAVNSWDSTKRPYFWCRFVPWDVRWGLTEDPNRKWSNKGVEGVLPLDDEWLQTHQYFTDRLKVKRGNEIKELTVEDENYYQAVFDIDGSASKLSVKIPTFRLKRSTELKKGIKVSIENGTPIAKEKAQTYPIEFIYSGHLGEKHSYAFPFKLAQDNAPLVNTLEFKEAVPPEKRKEASRLTLVNGAKVDIITLINGNSNTESLKWMPETRALPTETTGNKLKDANVMEVELPTSDGQNKKYLIIEYKGSLALKEVGRTRSFDLTIEDYAKYAAHLFVKEPDVFKEFNSPSFKNGDNPFKEYVILKSDTHGHVPMQLKTFHDNPLVRTKLRDIIEKQLNLPRGEFLTGEMILQHGYPTAHKNYLGKLNTLDRRFIVGNNDDPIAFAKDFIRTGGLGFAKYDAKTFDNVRKALSVVINKFENEKTTIQYKDPTGQFKREWPTWNILNFPFENKYLQLKAVTGGGQASVMAANAALKKKYATWRTNYIKALPLSRIFNEYWMKSIKPKLREEYSLDKIKAIHKKQMQMYAGDIFLHLQFLLKTKIKVNGKTFVPIVNVTLPESR